MKRTLLLVLAVLGVVAVIPVYGQAKPPASTSSGSDFYLDGGAVSSSILTAGEIDAGIVKANNAVLAVTVDAGTIKATTKFLVSGGSGSGSITPVDVSGSYNSGMIYDFENTSSASSSAHSYIRVTAAPGGGDPKEAWCVGATCSACGIDNSDSDAFVCSSSSGLGTTNFMKVASGSADVQHPGKVSVGTGGAPTYPLHVGGSPAGGAIAGFACGSITTSDTCVYALGPTITGNARMGDFSASATGNSQWQLTNSNNSNSAAHAKVEVKTGGSSGGDPKVVWTINAVNNWACGVDNSDSDAFVCGNSEALGTNPWMRVTTTEMGLGSTAIYPTIKFLVAGAPTAADCDADAERGRMAYDTTNHVLYICDGLTNGWASVALTP